MKDMLWCQPESSISLCFSQYWLAERIISNVFLLPTSCHILSNCIHSGDVGPTGRHESTGTHAQDSAATLRGNYNGSAHSSIIATMGTETIGTARVGDAGTESNQPERAMTQRERDELLLGVGSQFGSVSTSRVGESSAAGHEHR